MFPKFNLNSFLTSLLGGAQGRRDHLLAHSQFFLEIKQFLD